MNIPPVTGTGLFEQPDVPLSPLPDTSPSGAERRADDRTVRTSTLRVLHVINGEHYSGAERVQDLLALRLPEHGYEVGFACLKSGQFPAARRAKSAKLYSLPMGGKLDFRAAWRLARIVRGHEYRIIHAHTPRTALIGRIASAWTGVPMVYHVHSPAARDTTHRWRNWINALSERFSLGGASRLITVSRSLARHMREAGFAEGRISVVPNGVPSWDDVPERAAPTGPWTLGTVALFRPRKGTEILLDSLALLRHQGFPVRLRAVGPFETPEYETQIMDRAARLGLDDAIDWIGFTREVNAELSRMDLFVLPSLFGEGLPMVVLEAMAAGVPVVGTDVEGVPEAIRDGQEGLIARPGDADDLARTISRVIRGEVCWAQLRRRAICRQAEHFSDRSMAAGVAGAYDRVLERQ